jgi:hypothetical protein
MLESADSNAPSPLPVTCNETSAASDSGKLPPVKLSTLPS